MTTSDVEGGREAEGWRSVPQVRAGADGCCPCNCTACGCFDTDESPAPCVECACWPGDSAPSSVPEIKEEGEACGAEAGANHATDYELWTCELPRGHLGAHISFEIGGGEWTDATTRYESPAPRTNREGDQVNDAELARDVVAAHDALFELLEATRGWAIRDDEAELGRYWHEMIEDLGRAERRRAILAKGAVQ